MEITREDAGAGRLALRLAGAFPAAVVPEMRERIRQLVGERPSKAQGKAQEQIDLDLSGVESMDGSTMAVLLELRHELRARASPASTTS
jgi:ABC-type transporter Mla MlaB component